MNQFLELVLSGLALGSIYSLIALGLVVVFKATRVVNFAHGSILLLGVYVIGRLQADLGFWLACAIGIVAAGAAALVVEVVLIRRLRGGDLGALAILTLGVDIVLLTELTRRLGTDVLPIGAPWGANVVDILGFRLPESRVIAAIVSAILLVGFAVAFRLSDWGVAMRAAAEDGATAGLMGIRLSRVGAGAWFLAGALATAAGVFLVSFPSAGIDASVGLVALAAIPAWVLGGFDSPLGAVIGGLVIGVVSVLTAGYQDEIAFLGRGLGDVAPWVVMLLVLLVRPSGLFGTRELTRV